ncbi:hypothetical protein [Streptomyces sp. NPDC059649]|uniref:hypothetical protein n=1 Tax=Streptomyces sp. NPDC059649 TaxID=3346895 RepID=UPI003673A56F
MTHFDPADIAALRAQGDLTEFLLSLGGRTATPKKAQVEAPAPAYTIPHVGAWPLGTAATGVASAEHSCPRCRAQARPNLVALDGGLRDRHQHVTNDDRKAA